MCRAATPSRRWLRLLGGCLGEALGGLADRLDVATVEIADLRAVLEQHPVAQPLEAVGEDHLALGALGHAVHLLGGSHPVTHLQVELIGVRRGELVRLP